MMKRPKRLDFTSEEVDALMARIENQQLEATDFPLLADLVRALIWMEGALKEKQLSIMRLKAIFGIKTESAKSLSKLLNKTPDKNQNSNEGKDSTLTDSSEKATAEKNESPKGHGHRPSNDYQEAEIFNIAHEALKKGSICPECNKGKLFNLSPGTVLRIVGQPWLNVQIYKPERLRCPLCQKIYTAKLPKELYTESRVDKNS